MDKFYGCNVVQAFFLRLYSYFGDVLAEKVQEFLIRELGGLRVTFPTEEALCRQHRNRKIIKYFNGINHEELALRFEISVSQVRRILNNHDHVIDIDDI